MCFEICKDHRRKRGSSQQGEKSKETGEIRPKEWKHKYVKKKTKPNKLNFITFGAQKALVLTDRSYSESSDVLM